MKFSRNNAKYVRSLQSKKHRDKFNNFVAEGDKIGQEILKNRELQLEACFVSSKWEEAHAKLLQPHQELYTVVSPAEMKQLSGLRSPAEVLIVAAQPAWKLSDLSLSESWSLYLDGIQDPGNLGTILRIADWFGWSAVYCSKDTADPFNPKVIQATMGAFLRVPVIKIPLDELKNHTGHTPVYGAAMDGINVFSLEQPAPGILVIGNEGQGIRSTVEPLIDKWLSIPRGASAGAESLNAAVACGILCASLNEKTH